MDRISSVCLLQTILTPQIPFYTTLGQDCVTQGCGVDLFLFPNSYIDVATVGEVCRLTGGDIYKYDYFTVSIRLLRVKPVISRL